MYVDLAVAEMISRDSRPTTRTSPLERQRTILTEGDRILRIVTERVSSRSLFLPSARAFRGTKTPKLPKHGIGNSPERPWARTLSCSDQTGLDPIKGKNSGLPRPHAGSQGQSGMQAQKKPVAPLNPSTSGEMPPQSGSLLGFDTPLACRPLVGPKGPGCQNLSQPWPTLANLHENLHQPFIPKNVLQACKNN
eukprot:scaffold14573_cov75-Phaeocystis_antarctica.AAC.2